MPYSLDAEQALIAILLNDSNVINSLRIEEKHFYRQEHQIIVKHIIALNKKMSQVNVITVADELAKFDLLEKIGGIAYLDNVSSVYLSSRDYATYEATIEERYKLRAVIEIANKTLENAYTPKNQSITDICFNASSELAKLSQTSSSDTKTLGQSIKELMDEQINKIDKLSVNIIKTGYKSIDEVMQIETSKFIVIGARPGVGKSTVALALADDIARLNDCKVLFCSLEMTHKQLTVKLISKRTGINSQKLKLNDGMTSGDFDQIYNVAFDVSHKDDLIISTSYNPKLSDMVSLITNYKMNNPELKVVVIDYIQLVNSEGKTPYERVTEVSKTIKNLALKLDIVIIGAAQVNRQSTDKQEMPKMSQLRDSGSIEQDADVVIMLHRVEEEHKPEILQMDFQKNREGDTGMLEFTYERRYSRFAEMEYYGE